MDPIFIPFIIAAGVIAGLGITWAIGVVIMVAFSAAFVLTVAVVELTVGIIAVCLSGAQAKRIEQGARRHDHES
jgi:fructose-specific phosphotransferase system IIC component|tara:strand:- start:360 stop:581 length:222 start_codon:yes stop_codon:yes gene_type:complete